MGGTYDGDIVRALGLVTLYSGYAELEIDSLLDALAGSEAPGNQQRTWPVGRKLSEARRMVGRLASSDLAELMERLDQANALFDRRNALVHNGIFSSTLLVNSRVSGAEQPVTADALTELAQQLFSVKEHINAIRQRVLEPLLASRRAHGAT